MVYPLELITFRTMSKKDWLGIAYVSILVMVWGTVGSVIDYPLLQKNIYQPGSFGQISTFLIIGIVFTILGIILFPKFIESFHKD